MAALLTAAALALERTGVLPDAGRVLEWLSLPVVALGLVGVVHSDGSVATTLPTMAALGLMIVIFGLAPERHDRVRDAEVFPTIASAIDGEDERVVRPDGVVVRDISVPLDQHRGHGSDSSRSKSHP